MKTKILYTVIFTILFYFSFLSGCSEDSSVNNPITPPTTQTDTLIGTLVSTINSITVSSNDEIIFRFTVNPGTGFTDSVTHLIKTVNNIDTEIGLLKDNGNLQNGDEIAHDNVYSGKFIFNESSAGEIKFKAKGNISTVSTGYSQSLTISVYSQLNSQEIGTLFLTQANAKVQLQTFLGGNPGNIENASNQLSSWLLTQPGVQSIEKNGNTGIIIYYTSGITGGILYSVANSSGQITTLGGGEISDSVRRNNIKIPLQKQTTGINDFYKESEVSFSDNPPLDPNIIGNRNVMIYEPFQASFPSYPVGPKITARLNQSLCRDYNVTTFLNQEANIAALSNMTSYGLVFMTTHGLTGKRIFTGEIADTNAQIYKTQYKSMIKSNKLSIWKNLVIAVNGTVNVTGDVYVVTDKFISELSGTFPNSVIVNNSCESSMNPNLGNAFIAKGAKTYFGYSKVVHIDFAAIISDSIAKRLAVDGKTTGNTFFAAIDPQSPNAVFNKITGSNDLNFSTSLVNKDFELGKIEGWTKSGDGRVISRLGTVNPSQGSFMGIISTGLGYTTSSGSISQCMLVQNNQSTLKLKWNFLSEEFLEFIHSQFQDYLRITLVQQNGTEVTLLSKTIDGIATQFGADTNHAGQLISVSPNIVFDQGGVYMTGWQELSFDITPYRGQTVVIIFKCGDVGDSIYDTAILLDDIIIQ
ncbi:MAG TPA: hypothetical protein PKD83_05955 [Ignavibacteria bacterium]|nr:hypothetical protein [Ignavibacteria bacterium]